MKTKEIEYEDDIVIVYDAEGREIYRGLEDYEPNKDEPWVYNEKTREYTYNGMRKVCLAL